MGSAQAEPIGAAVMPLVESARTHPVAAARLESQMVTAPTDQRIAGFTLTSIGDQSVSLRLDPETFVLIARDGDSALLPAPQMGLVDAKGRLLDGLYQIAELAPGELGACTIVLADPPFAGPPAHGALRGWLTLVGPWPLAPVEGFEASSTVRVLSAP